MAKFTTDECPHWHLVGYLKPAVYPEQENLKPGQAYCRNCESVIPDPVAEHEKFVSEQECLRGPDGCEGPIQERASFAGTGTMIYECGKHMEESHKRDQELRERYPDTDCPPSWFDPMYAGESWNGDY